MRANNDLPLCHSEAVALMEFTSGLVDDGELGVVTKQDLMALMQLYASSPASSKLLISSSKC